MSEPQDEMRGPRVGDGLLKRSCRVCGELYYAATATAGREDGTCGRPGCRPLPVSVATYRHRGRIVKVYR